MKRLVLLALGIVGVTSAFAETDLLSTGFEDPFTAGPLGSQQQWIVQGDPYLVTTASPFVRTGSQGVSFDGVSAAATSWAWVDLLHTPTAAEPIIHTTVYVYIETDPLNRGVTSAFGLDAYRDVPSFTRTGAVRLRADGNAQVLGSGGILGITPSPVGAADQWNRLDLILNTATDTGQALVNGVDTGFTIPLLDGMNVSDVDLYSVPLAFHLAGFDDFSITARAAGVGLKISSPDVTALHKEKAEVMFAPTNGDPATTATAAIGENGFLMAGAPGPGTFKVLVRTATHLWKNAGTVTITNADQFITGTAVLTNGDIDGDNSVTVFDYDKLSAYFDKTSADADWSTEDGDGVAPKEADLDRDGSVTVFDYDVLSANFDQVGD